MSKRLVHLSNSEGDIEVDRLEDTVRVLDVPKALKLYRDNPDSDFSVGMKVDWYWTGNTVREESDITNYHCMITDWDTPCVEIDDKKIDCYVEIPAHIPKTLETYVKRRMKASEDMKKFVEQHKKEKL